MAKRLPCERHRYFDEKTGVPVTQVSTYPLMHDHPYFYITAFSPDDRTALFMCQRRIERGAPYDLFCADSDGSNLTLIYEDFNSSCVCAAPDRRCAYYMQPDGLHRHDFDTLEDTLVSSDEKLPRGGGGPFVSPDGRYFYTFSGLADGKYGIPRVDLQTGECEIIFSCDKWFNHLVLNPADPTVMLFNLTDAGTVVYDIKTGKWQKVEHEHIAHMSWMGETGKMLVTTARGKEGIEIFDPYDAKNVLQKITGEYFWHAGVDRSGEWAVADTNWPDNGLFLIHTATGRKKQLCISGGTNSNMDITHAHPLVSPNAKYVMYNSNRTGINQIYIAEIPDAMKNELRTGLRHRERDTTEIDIK